MAKQKYGVLILHGLSSSLDCVNGIQKALEPTGIPTRMPVLRGHGAASPEALRGVRWQDWVEDGRNALMDLHTEVDEAIIFGHSMGGCVAIQLAAENHRSIDSMVLAAAAIELASPLSPGKPLNFLVPLMASLLKKWDMPPRYADPSLAQYNTNYPWLPIDAVVEFNSLVKDSRKRLPAIQYPMLIMQSRKDTTVAPASAEIIYKETSTPVEQKRVVWYETTEHEMFRDCERDNTIGDVAAYIKERVM